ncbi:uncharacterized protein F4817DRAFT_317959 [Daldinia loculata]|uniref:uncharacterized protein n=1 Tax=Daldinia loculata TaxID=103429 RepID=UPI0020C475CE|nr:uncharacterized protein F4817DRAFT_317959 [Daldinia loculata]KAI1645247.1 hypothetical protein F4817DRAFT_317959 [Daldinia loculata]
MQWKLGTPLWWAVSGVWKDADLDKTVIRAADRLRCEIENIAEEGGDLQKVSFMNDAGPTQTVLESYGTENLKKMRDVAAKYDPYGVFQELENDGVLLRNI